MGRQTSHRITTIFNHEDLLPPKNEATQFTASSLCWTREVSTSAVSGECDWCAECALCTLLFDSIEYIHLPHHALLFLFEMSSSAAATSTTTTSTATTIMVGASAQEISERMHQRIDLNDTNHYNNNNNNDTYSSSNGAITKSNTSDGLKDASKPKRTCIRFTIHRQLLRKHLYMH